MYNIIIKYNLFSIELVKSGFYNIYLENLNEQACKDDIISRLLDVIIEEDDLLKLLRIYNHDFRKIKSKIVLPISQINDKIIQKISVFGLFEIKNNGSNYILEKIQPPRLI